MVRSSAILTWEQAFLLNVSDLYWHLHSIDSGLSAVFQWTDYAFSAKLQKKKEKMGPYCDTTNRKNF